MCVFIYTYIYIYIYGSTSIHVCVFICTYIYMYIHTHTHTCIRMYVCMYICMYVCMHAYAHTHMHLVITVLSATLGLGLCCQLLEHVQRREACVCVCVCVCVCAGTHAHTFKLFMQTPSRVPPFLSLSHSSSLSLSIYTYLHTHMRIQSHAGGRGVKTIDTGLFKLDLFLHVELLLVEVAADAVLKTLHHAHAASASRASTRAETQCVLPRWACTALAHAHARACARRA